MNLSFQLQIRREPLRIDGHTNGTVVIDGYTKGTPLNRMPAQILFLSRF